MNTRLERKQRLIEALAHFLVDNQAGKSIMLQMEVARSPIVPFAKEWATLRGASTLHGYPTFDEAVESLKELLG